MCLLCFESLPANGFTVQGIKPAHHSDSVPDQTKRFEATLLCLNKWIFIFIVKQ